MKSNNPDQKWIFDFLFWNSSVLHLESHYFKDFLKFILQPLKYFFLNLNMNQANEFLE